MRTKKDKRTFIYGILACLCTLAIINLFFAFGLVVLYVVVAVLLLYIAFTYYKANKAYDADKVERIASIVFPEDYDRAYGTWSVYILNKKMLSSLPQEIFTLEIEALSFEGVNPSVLCDILAEREEKNRIYQSLLEIQDEPDFYTPPTDGFYEYAVKMYLDRTFAYVYNGAKSLKTEEEKKDRYVRYLDRFAKCYETMPDEARQVIEDFMDAHKITFSTNHRERKVEAKKDVKVS